MPTDWRPICYLAVIATKWCPLAAPRPFLRGAPRVCFDQSYAAGDGQKCFIANRGMPKWQQAPGTRRGDPRSQLFK